MAMGQKSQIVAPVNIPIPLKWVVNSPTPWDPKTVLTTATLAWLKIRESQGKPQVFVGKALSKAPFCFMFLSHSHTVDGRNPAPPKKPWNDDPPANTNKQWFSMISKWCEMDFVHPQYLCF